MKHIKKFANDAEYQAFVGGGDYVTPNVCLNVETGNIVCESYIAPPPPMSVGDVAYWDGSNVKTTPLNNWNTSLGTPIGVVVIPRNLLPDNKARIINLKEGGVVYPKYENVTAVIEMKIPITNNTDLLSNNYNEYYGYMPSDNFSGITSFVDPKAKYASTTNLIPSPYLDDDNTLNPEYCKELEGGNVLSDFNGLGNTIKYDDIEIDNVSNLQWYFPAAGELGFLMARFKIISDSIEKLGGDDFNSWSSGYQGYVSSTYFSDEYETFSFRLSILAGYFFWECLDFPYYIRKFAIL